MATRAEELKAWARDYTKKGWVPIAVSRDTDPAVPMEKRRKAAKAPAPGLMWKEITLENWESYWPQGWDQNLGLRTGPETGVVGVDVDVKDGGLARWEELVAENGEWETATVETAGGGYHKYGRWDERAATLANRDHVGKDGAGLDTRAANGYLVAPPSRLPDGGEYRWAGEGPGALAPMPAWVFEEVAPAGLKKKEAEPSTAEPPTEEASEPALPAARPRLGESVDVDGAREQLITAELVEEVLAHVACPSDAVVWGGLMQNVKSLLPEGEEEKGAVGRELYKVFDKWCQGGENYDMMGNLDAWKTARAEKGDFRTLIGLAVRDGGLRRGRFPEVMDTRARFFVTDLLALRFAEEPYPLETLRVAFSRCLAHVSNSPTFWIVKQKAPEGHSDFKIVSSLAEWASYRFKVQGEPKPMSLPALAETRFLGSLDFEQADDHPYPPGQPSHEPGVFNLYPGLVADLPEPPANLEPAQPWRDHLVNVWCGGEGPEVADYLIKWLAFLFQRPAEKPGVLVCLQSEQGAGKNIFTDWLRDKVLGPGLYFESQRMEQILGKFNGALVGKRLVLCDEASMGGDSWDSLNNSLKGLTTGTRMAIERKGKETITMNTFAAFMIFSNHENPVRVEKSDRRHLCLKVSSHRVGDRAYWHKMLAAAKDPKAPGAFLAWLMSVDLSGFNPANVPTTQTKRELITAGLLSSERFLQEILNEPKPEAEEDPGDHFQEPCASFYHRYAEWCKTNGEKWVQSNIRFGVVAKSMGFQKTHPRTANGRLWHYVHLLAPPGRLL